MKIWNLLAAVGLAAMLAGPAQAGDSGAKAPAFSGVLTYLVETRMKENVDAAVAAVQANAGNDASDNRPQPVPDDVPLVAAQPQTDAARHN
jgi:hypothetical protein